MSAVKSYDVLAVIERGTGKSFFTKIGAAFPAKGGQVFNLSLDALPINRSLLLRTPKAKADGKGGAQ